MQPDSEKIREKLRQNFFEISAQGILVYQDPVIGPLFNSRKKIAVHVNTEQGCLELKVNGRLEETFDFAQNVGRACQEACGAYFNVIAQQNTDQEAIQTA
jgi:hypothetical protein